MTEIGLVRSPGVYQTAGGAVEGGGQTEFGLACGSINAREHGTVQGSGRKSGYFGAWTHAEFSGIDTRTGVGDRGAWQIAKEPAGPNSTAA